MSASERERRKRPALVFIGFMCAGKSRALRAARAAGLDGIDADELLKDELGMPVPEFFRRHGEAEFRAREEELTTTLLGRADGGAIALGGGAVLSERVRAALGRHLVAWLDVSLEDAWERAAGRADRPLAADRSRFEELYHARRPVYEGLADAFLPGGGGDLAERALPGLLGLSELPPGTSLLWARSASADYPVFIGEGMLGSGYWPLPRRRFCITDTTVGDLYSDAIGPLSARIDVEPGEAAKTLASAERVLTRLAEAAMTRSDHVVALGGGVVGDLAGFCAATYQRGVPVVQVPTTLLAQVDSAYGGKTGVDLPAAKNYVGAYHQPAAVIADTATLSTLPPEELAAGFVEALKTGLLAGGRLWERVRSLPQTDPGALREVVLGCARFKTAVVAADERDAGRRAILNLGHTVGHAIEAATSYQRYRHGEAIGLGLLAALRLSGATDLREEVRAMLERRGLPTRLDPGVEVAGILSAIERDKKRTADGLRLVLLERPGEPREGQEVDPGSVRAAVEELQ
jgi:shikimate kinase/3-dehydroquinate synthase